MKISEITQDIDVVFNYVAKDADGTITLFVDKPVFNKDKGIWEGCCYSANFPDWLHVSWDVDDNLLRLI